MSPPESQLILPSIAPLSNGQVAARLDGLAQALAAGNENPFKVRAYRRAAETLRALPVSIDDAVQRDADLTAYPGIGEGISAAIREIVRSGTLASLEAIRSQANPVVRELADFPRVDPRLAQRALRKLGLPSVASLRRELLHTEVAGKLGLRLVQQLRAGFAETTAMLLFDADPLAETLRHHLLKEGRAIRVVVAGDVRRRVEVVTAISFLVETNHFPRVVAAARRFGGRTDLVVSGKSRAVLRLPQGIELELTLAARATWGCSLLATTGSAAHLRELERVGPSLARLRQLGSKLGTEAAVYRRLDLAFVEPELREGHDEVQRARDRELPELVTMADVRGELHAHTTGSDGVDSLEQMAEAAKARGYLYLGITEHSQSLKIARGLSVQGLRQQLRRIDKFNGRQRGFRLLKAAEVDILADGSLDYPDDLLAELDYTICSIHSRFQLGRAEQTERILRAMDHPRFCILGHATGRRLLRRPGYELDFERIVAHAKQRGCFFEINSSPERLDLSAEHARIVREAGIKIAICTDAHASAELDFLRYGVDQARRAGCAKEHILNSRPWTQLGRLLRA